MKIKRFHRLLALLFISLPVMAEAENFEDSGWYVGGALGHMQFDAEYVPGIDFDGKSGDIGVYGGYNFNRLFGLELAIIESGELSDNSGYDSSFSEIAFTPKLNIPIGQRLSFYVKGGIAIAAYSEIYDYVPMWSDDEFYWGGYGLTAGAGMQISVMKHLLLRLSYDYSDLEFEPTEDTYFAGFFYLPVPDIEATSSRTSIGMHYQF